MRKTAVTLLLLALALLPPLARGAPGQQLTVEELACRGNATTSCTFILGQIYLAPGDALDEEEIQNAKLRLSVLRNFSSVSIYLEKGSERGKARVIVDVVERSPITTFLGSGLLSINSDLLQTVNARVTDTNLFGTGKILDLRAGGLTPIDQEQGTNRGIYTRLSYVDPHLFDSKRNFMSAGMGWFDSHFERAETGDRIDRRQLSLDFSFGRRLWDFSYFSMGYQYRPVRELFQQVREEDGHFETHTRLRSGVLIYSFGWNTEDDPYFATRGSVLQSVVIASGGESEDWNTVIRKTWSWGRTAMFFQLETPTERTFGLARPIPPSDAFGGIQRGRWFVTANTLIVAHTEDGRDIRGAGLTAGVLLETRSYGIVRLFVFRNTEFK
jgi:outer membrane protein assembly factor BamA